MQKVKDTIPVYDICSLSGAGHLHQEIMAERFGPYLQVHPNLHRAHGHTFYHLVLFTEGAGFHTIDFRRYPVLAGQMYFMVPGQVHSWDFEGEVDGFVVNFPETLFSGFLADHRYLEKFSFLSVNALDPILQLNDSERHEAARLLEQLVEECARPQAFNEDMVRIRLLSLFILVARAAGLSPAAPDTTHPRLLVLHNFRMLVNQHYDQYKLPREYAAMLYVTPNHLNALCQDLLGKSAGELIRERILLEAKRMLVNAGTSIADIGYRLGFRDNSYFTKFFKKYTGITPETFRRDLPVSST
jgi:AraC-like DNA-binding protein